TNTRSGAAALIHKVRRRLMGASSRLRLEAFIERKLVEHRADLLHIHFGTFAVSLLGLLDRVSLPVIVTLYGVDASAALLDAAMVPGYRRLYGRASRIVALSEIVRERLERTGCSPDRIAVWD